MGPWFAVSFAFNAAASVAMFLTAGGPIGWVTGGWCAGLAFCSLLDWAFSR